MIIGRRKKRKGKTWKLIWGSVSRFLNNRMFAEINLKMDGEGKKEPRLEGKVNLIGNLVKQKGGGEGRKAEESVTTITK